MPRMIQRSRNVQQIAPATISTKKVVSAYSKPLMVKVVTVPTRATTRDIAKMMARNSPTINDTIPQHMVDYFSLKGVFDDIGDGIRKGAESVTDRVVRGVGKRAGASSETVNRAMESEGYKTVRGKFSSDTVGVAKNAAISIATLGVAAGANAIASGAQAAQAAGAGAQAAQGVAQGAQVAQGVATGAKGAALVAKGANLLKTGQTIAKVATAGAGLIAATKSKDPKKIQQGLQEVSDATGKSTGEIASDLGIDTQGGTFGGNARSLAGDVQNVINSGLRDIGGTITGDAEKDMQTFVKDVVGPATGKDLSGLSPKLAEKVGLEFMGKIKAKKDAGQSLPPMYDKIAKETGKAEEKAEREVTAGFSASPGVMAGVLLVAIALLAK
jgi:hypothetical protein